MLPPTREEVTRPETQLRRDQALRLEVEGGIERAPCALDNPEFRDIRFTLRGAQFKGLREVRPEDLAHAYAGLVGTEQPISVVCEIRDRAADILRDSGYIAAVEVPEQRIADGIVRFRVVMAHLTQIRVRGDAAGAEKIIAGYLNQLTEQPVFNRNDAERYLLLASDLPGYIVRLTLRPTGEAPGEVFGDVTVQRTPVDDYRIVHFATHGVVTATRPKCPTQPALLTSFGGEGSDGLLTFRDIFDLNFDADIVILSACDTAGAATAIATQSAGIGTGGDVALDGLVRAFVGAGGRLVIASHWPVPDDFDATERLITGLFTAPPGTPAVTALRQSQHELMDDADTSHPFYWSAFAAVGDGDTAVIRASTQIAGKR